MKKIALALCLAILVSAALTMTACTVKENGVEIRYATLTLS